jgi:hypothetical protein
MTANLRRTSKIDNHRSEEQPQKTAPKSVTHEGRTYSQIQEADDNESNFKYIFPWVVWTILMAASLINGSLWKR